MRRFYFTAKNLGAERFLTYTMGEGMDIDEDVLDYCEENTVPEIIDIIYEEDDDFDYITYDISGRMTVEDFIQGTMDKEKVFNLLRNISMGMININEYAIPLSYILLNKSYMYINPDTLEIKFLYLPVEGEASVAVEFKSFVRQLVAGMKFNLDEDLSYVGQLLTYINGNGFNLRGLIGLTEALMQDSNISFGSDSGISTDDGAEIVNDVAPEPVEESKGTMDFMNDLGEADGKLPEIGDDEDDIELEEVSQTAEAEATPSVETAETAEKVAGKETEKDIDELTARIQELAGKDKIHEPESVSMQKPVRVSRAAMLKAAAENIEEEKEAAAAAEAEAAPEAAENGAAEDKADEKAKKQKEKKAKGKDKDKDKDIGKDKDNDKTDSAENEKPAEEEKKASGVLNSIRPKSNEIVDNTILGNAGTLKINPYLIRVNTKEKAIIDKPVFKIGKASRGVDYHVGGNGAISRQHAIILHKGDSYYIKDNKSTNHTYVDQKPVEGDEEVLLKNDCTITLGDEDFTFKIS